MSPTRLILVAILAFGLLGSVGKSAAQSAKTGIVEVLTGKEREPIDVSRVWPDGVVWLKEFSRAGRRYLRLYIDEIKDTSNVNYTIQISDGTRNVFEYDRKSFSRRKAFWTGLIGGDTATVRLVTDDGDAPEGLHFAITKIAYDHGGGTILSTTGVDDREEIVSYTKSDPGLVEAANSVAILSFIANDASYTCTGFMISDDLLMTNEHCVRTEAICETTAIYFGYQYDESMQVDWGNPIECIGLGAPPNASLDFSILRVSGKPGHSAKWGRLLPSSNAITKDLPLSVIEHPASLPKQVSKVGCIVNTEEAVGSKADLKSDFGHFCDTLSGSSGSPVLTSDNRVIGIHHLGFDETSERWDKENRAVRIDYVKTELKNLCFAGKMACVPGWTE